MLFPASDNPNTVPDRNNPVVAPLVKECEGVPADPLPVNNWPVVDKVPVFVVLDDMATGPVNVEDPVTERFPPTVVFVLVKAPLKVPAPVNTDVPVTERFPPTVVFVLVTDPVNVDVPDAFRVITVTVEIVKTSVDVE